MHGTSRMFASVVTTVILTAANAHAQARQDSVDAITRHYQALHEALNGEDADLRIRQRQFLALREKSRADKRALLTPAQQAIHDRNA